MPETTYLTAATLRFHEPLSSPPFSKPVKMRVSVSYDPKNPPNTNFATDQMRRNFTKKHTDRPQNTHSRLHCTWKVKMLSSMLRAFYNSKSDYEQTTPWGF